MNDLDRPDHIDALGRRAAAGLRADVQRRHRADGTDSVDAALDRVQHGTGATLVSLVPDASPTRRLRSAWMGAAAAAVAVVIGTGAFLIAGDDEGSRVVPADTSAPSPATRNDTTNDTDVSPDTTVTDPTPASTLPGGLASTTTAVDEPVATTPALPATEVDALEGVVPPPPLDPSDPALVPGLLPPTPVADPSLVRLVEYSTPIEAVTGLHQTWASADGRILSISTDLGRASSELDVTSVEVWPWDDARLMNSMSSGISLLTLSDPSGEVSLWGAGFARDELVDIARTMALSPEGWRLDATATADLVLLHEGWNRAFATRSLQWDDAGRQGEVLVNVGVPDTIRAPYYPGIAATVVDSINGAPALVTDLGSGRSAISWSPAPDVVVLIGISGTTAEVIELARSMTFVAVATWNAAGIADSSPADGCNSYFFC